MTTAQSVRYDFGRCTVEHVGSHQHQVPMSFANSVATMSKPGVVLRVKQGHYDSPDEAQFTLLGVDARMLATHILEALGDE